MASPRVIFRPHAPLMWVAGALMTGYSVAENWPWLVKENIWGWTTLGAVGILAAVWAQRAKLWSARIFLAMGVGALGVIYYNAREERVEIPEEMRAPREAVVIVEPRQSFALRSDSRREAGVGIVRGVISPTNSPYLERQDYPTDVSARLQSKPPEYVYGNSYKSLIGQKINYSAQWKLEEPLELGAWIKMKGVISPNENINGGFEEYLERSHIPWSIARAEALEIEKPAAPLAHAIAQLHTQAVNVLRERWQEEGDRSLLPAVVIGDKNDLTKAQKENMVRSGTMHLVAVSGMNVMAVAVVAWGLVKILGLPRVAQAVGVVGLLGLYSLVAGWGPSVLRAWGMVALGMGAWALRRQMNLWAIVVLAATISLIWEPLSFLHAGWRLSFGVVSGIVLGMGAVERWGVLNRLRGAASWLANLCMIGLVAGISVAPMTAAYWGVVQPLGFVINAVAVTLAEAVTILGTLSWLTAWIPYAAKTLNEVSYFLLGIIEGSIKLYLTLPGAAVEVIGAKTIGTEVVGTAIVLGVFYILARWGWKRER